MNLRHLRRLLLSTTIKCFLFLSQYVFFSLFSDDVVGKKWAGWGKSWMII